MVDGTKSSIEDQEDEDAEVARVCRQVGIVIDFKESCFCAMLRLD